MATWCLLKTYADKFKKALKDGAIRPEVLVKMTSEQRRNFLAEYVGKDNAVQVNALFESKLLLKNQKAGMVNWAKRTANLTEPARRDILAKIEKLDTVLTPETEDAFLQDLASTKLNIDVSADEAKTISELSEKLQELKKNYDFKTETWTSKEVATQYGATQVALENYLNELRTGNVKQTLSDRKEQFVNEAQTNKPMAVKNLLLDTANTIANLSTSTVATLDNSLFGRQGIIALLSGHPKIWGSAFAKSFSDIVQTLGGKNTTDALLADLYADPLYMNGEYQKAKIIDTNEEQYPIDLGNIPILGRPIKASESAFKNGSLRMRTQLYKLLRDIKVSSGIEMTREQIEGTGKVVNSMLARGDLGMTGRSPILKLLMWAPKMLKADFDILTAHSFDKIPIQDRVTARWNLAKIILATAIITGVASATGQKEELDPRSSDFLKIGGKVGYLRGIPQIITLMARLLTGEYKNNKGEIVKYSGDFGKLSRLDALINFVRGKAPPATGGVYDVLSGKDFAGNEPTFTSVLLQRGVAISLQNLIQLNKDPSIDRAFGVLLDFFGLGSSLTPDPNIISKVIPEGKKVSERDLLDYVKVYAKAIGTDPGTAFNRMFTGQEIVKVSDGGIIVVRRQPVADSEKFKKEFAKKYGGDVKKMRLDHVIPNALGGPETPDDWAVVPASVWASNTKVETTMISAVKNGKLSKKEAENHILRFKRPSKDSYGYVHINPDKEYGLMLIKKYK